LGLFYLVPYGNNCKPIIGYKGLIELVMRTGKFTNIEARTVHEQDHFSYSFGLNTDLVHRPAWDKRGNLTHAYAIARPKKGEPFFDVMGLDEIERIRKSSKAGNNGPWINHYEEMAKKTVLRRMLKLVPSSIEVAQAIALDDEAEAQERLAKPMPERYLAAMDEAAEASKQEQEKLDLVIQKDILRNRITFLKQSGKEVPAIDVDSLDMIGCIHALERLA
jgi:recombinational DNA repair protein RecT